LVGARGGLSLGLKGHFKDCGLTRVLPLTNFIRPMWLRNLLLYVLNQLGFLTALRKKLNWPACKESAFEGTPSWTERKTQVHGISARIARWKQV